MYKKKNMLTFAPKLKNNIENARKLSYRREPRKG